MYSSKKIISENNVERTKQKNLKSSIRKFALYGPDGTTLDKFATS